MKPAKQFIINILKLIFTMLLVIVFGYMLLILLTLSMAYRHQNLGPFLFAFTVISFVCLWQLIWHRRFLAKHKKVIIPVWAIAFLSVAGIASYNNYVDSIPTVKDLSQKGIISYWALYPYEPYRGELTAKLKEESTLKFANDLPKIDCATALYPVAASFVQAMYLEQDYGVKDSVLSCTTTTGAYEKLVKGDVDIIFVAEPSDEQLAMALSEGVELNFTPIGKEAFVFFVNSKNKVDNLTAEQIQGIYSGEITNWKQLGGKNENIRAFQREENSGSQTALVRMMDGKNLIAPIKEDVVDGMGGIINQVADYKNYGNAIGYSFRFYSTEMTKNNQIKLLKLNGIYPDKDTIRNGEYPITGDFYAVTAGTANPNVQLLIDWILSPQGQYLIEETGYVSIK